ncbi:MAG: hypothetical protein ACFFBD_10485 [Candidatus Hodarchaeota archaeon]
MRYLELVEEFYHFKPGEIVRTEMYLVETTKDTIFIPVKNDDLVVGAVFLSQEDGIVIKADTIIFTREGAVGEPTVRSDDEMLFISDMTVSANPVDDPQPIVGLTREECLQKAEDIIKNMEGDSWRTHVKKANWLLSRREPSLIAFCPSFDDQTKFFLIGTDEAMIVIDGKHVVIRKDDSMVDVGPGGVVIVKESGKIVNVGKHGIKIGDHFEIGKGKFKIGKWRM